MVYPAVVICVAVGILMFIMVFIIPKFKKIFDEFNLQLPWMTKTLIDVSRLDGQVLVLDPHLPGRLLAAAQADPPEQDRELRARLADPAGSPSSAGW